MRVLVTGGTGFVGTALCRALRGARHEVTVVTREPADATERAVGWDAVPASIATHDAVVNLAGEPIAAHRWTARQRERIRSSRIEATRSVVEAIRKAPRRPAVLVSASAVGFYGPHGDEPLDETAGAGNDFLAEVTRAWEAEAVAAEALGVRVVRLRLGIVLAADGGALDRMLPPFRAFVGGPLGDGRQWMSWIHRDDVLGLAMAALEDERWSGAVNATAPAPVTNRDFAATLGRVLARPSWFPVPAFALRLALGELAEMLLSGQRALPAAAQRLEYPFRYAALEAALRASVRR